MPAINLVNPPTDGRGSPGDGPGMFAIDSAGNLYYCFKQYNGVDRIWKYTNPLSTLTQQLAPPAMPVITSCSSTLPPLIQGTLSTPPQNGYARQVFISGTCVTPSTNAIGVTAFSGRTTVNGNSWSYQVPSSGGLYPYSPGAWLIRANSVFVDLSNGGDVSNSSPSFSYNKTLVGPPLPPPPPPTIIVNALNSWDKKSASITWITTDATSLKVNGGQYVNKILRVPNSQIGEWLTVTQSGTYTFTATGPGGPKSVVQSISLLGR